MKKLIITLAISMAMVSLAAAACAGAASGKKVLFIDSYHQGYAWSDGIEQGLKAALKGSGVVFKVVRMDTKRNTSEDFKKKAALKAKAIIDEFKPDVVIAADDNASKYLIEPFYRGKDLPFVFCGVNWDASGYGFPAKNVTGMLEVTPVDGLLGELSKFAKGERIGFLAPDILTARKEAENVKKVFGLTLVEYYAKNADDWMKGFAEMQGKVDMLIMDSDGGLWPETKAKRIEFVTKNTKIATGACYDFMAPYAIITFSKVAQEQGMWAGQAALKILGGAPVSSVPIAKNKEGKLIVNAKIAQAAGAKVPFEVINAADKVIE